MMRNLWNDEAGFIISAELVLVATIVVIGMVVGLCVVRNQVVQELVDVGQAIGAVSQSYCFSGISCIKPQGTVGWTAGTCYVDLVDFCQTPQRAGDPPGGLVLANLMPYVGPPVHGEQQ